MGWYPPAALQGTRPEPVTETGPGPVDVDAAVEMFSKAKVPKTLEEALQGALKYPGPPAPSAAPQGIFQIPTAELLKTGCVGCSQHFHSYIVFASGWIPRPFQAAQMPGATLPKGTPLAFSCRQS